MKDRMITIRGTGKVSVKPDYTVISMTLKAQEMAYEKAMSEAARQLDSLRSAIVGIGFAREDLKTTDFGVRPEFDGERDANGNYKRWFAGYVVTHRLKIEFDFDMDRLARTLSTLAQSLADPEFSIEFTVKDKEAVAAALLESAAARAKETAQALCRAAGVSLGELLAIDYNWAELRLASDTRYDMLESRQLAAPCASIEIEPDDIDVSDSVTFVWAIV